jgi:hypothetical protein
LEGIGEDDEMAQRQGLQNLTFGLIDVRERQWAADY